MDWRSYIAGLLVGIGSQALFDSKFGPAIILFAIAGFMLAWADAVPNRRPDDHVSR